MASTINSYEGTGRSHSLKLIQQLRSLSTNAKEGLPAVNTSSRIGNSRLLRELQLIEPIRYALGDPVEKWLNNLLCLDAASVPLKAMNMPHPDKCELYAVNRDTLFSFHKASEVFLQRMMALYVASHYKNTPNDLQLIADAPAHHLYVLLAPVEDETSLPDVLCVLQVCHEGQISKQTILSSLARGKRAGGDLIPWTISQQFQDDDFASLSGARVVRIAVHPDMQHMGYGSRAINLLEKYYKGELYNGEAEEEDEDVAAPSPAVEGDGLLTETIKPRSNLKPLLVKMEDKKPICLHWLGVSYGLTPSLYRFWHRQGLLPVYLRQTTNDITGEHTMVMLKALQSDAQIVSCRTDWLRAFYDDFRRRFINLLGFQFKNFSPSLCLDILENKSGIESNNSTSIAYLSAYDLKRLESYASNMIDYHMIMDLVPSLAREYFMAGKGNRALSFSPVQAAILLGLGLQNRLIEDMEKELKLPVSQLLAMFIKCIRKFANRHLDLKMEALDGNGDPKEVISLSKKRAIEDDEAWDPTLQNLDDDLQEAADEATEKLRSKQREMINALPLDQFRIAGTDEEWQNEIKKKKKNLTGSLLNISSNSNGKAGKKAASKDVAAEAKKMSMKKGKVLKR